MAPSQPAGEFSEDARRRINELIRGQSLGVLATKDRDGHPYASLIAYAAVKNNTELLFVTPTATRKHDNLGHDGRVALLIENSANQPSDFREAMAVTVLGNARPLFGKEKETALTAYLERHPSLERFARSSACALFAIQVSGYTMTEKFQNGSEKG